MVELTFVRYDTLYSVLNLVLSHCQHNFLLLFKADFTRDELRKGFFFRFNIWLAFIIDWRISRRCPHHTLITQIVPLCVLNATRLVNCWIRNQIWLLWSSMKKWNGLWSNRTFSYTFWRIWSLSMRSICSC